MASTSTSSGCIRQRPQRLQGSDAMIASLLRDRDEASGHAPHVSHSRINRYLTCPEQYRLYYIENLRPKVPPATLVFGSIMHQSLAELIGKKKDPVKHFVD